MATGRRPGERLPRRIRMRRWPPPTHVSRKCHTTLRLAEAKDEVLKRVVGRAAEVDQKRLRRAVRDYGNERTKKFFERALRKNEMHTA